MTADRIDMLIEIVTRLENKLDAWSDIPEEVKQIRAAVDEMRQAEKAEKQMRETWRDAAYRAVTTFARWIKPQERHP